MGYYLEKSKKIVLGMKDGDVASAAAKAGLASRTNTLFSVPMLMYMVYSAHAQGSYLVLDDWNMTSLRGPTKKKKRKKKN